MGIEGSAAKPRLLTLSAMLDEESTAIELVQNETNERALGKIVGYYSLSGQFVSSRATGLTKGIYIVKTENGKHSKILVQ